MKIKYNTLGGYGGEELNFAEEFETTWDLDDLDYIATDIAEYYHDNCDGWENSWPLTFIIWDMEDKELGRFLVERESQPVFSASQIKEIGKE